MKKLATVLCTGALALGAYAQGTINIGNGPYALVSTNATAMGGAAGVTATTLGGFNYGIFTAGSAVTTVDTSLQQLLSSTWTFTGAYATNTAVSTGGRLNGGSGVVVPQGWAAGVTNSFLMVGWSASLGSTWAQVASQLNGATLTGGLWTGPNWTQGGYLGASVITFGAAGGGTSGLPAFGVFGTTPTGQGTPIGTGWNLYAIQVPEPGTLALAGLGAAAMLIFRRRK